MIDKRRLYKTFESLTMIDSISLNEADMARVLTDKLESLGFLVTADGTGVITGSDTGNILARLNSNSDKDAQTILLSAHMDTVGPGTGKRAILHEDGTITSDKSTVLGADDVSGIAEILEAVEEVIEEGTPRHNIEILFTVAEELYTVGASAFDVSAIRADRAYFLDRTGPIGSVTISEPTLISFEIEIEGRSSHAGFEPEKGINAIVVASRAIASLPIGRKNANTTLAIGIIEGGTATNVVPDHVIVKGEIRSRIHEEALDTLNEVGEAFEAEAGRAGAKSRLRHKVHLTAYRVPEGSAALAAYKETLIEEEITYTPEISFGGSDCNPFRRQDIDGICIANAMWNIHSVDEYTTLDEMAQVTQIVKGLITK